ncbi:MAG: hypothetical protein GTO45_37450 [Candidatus Aminicenantes bacterium]|nr:hypothetical protein [Candidatus Aminicenantes bacterium]NIM84352.1 hypothetical protein [Candidatus Aminicenantes bacterium]NIN23838.1 hypothetical protein [Candidatus Aminicenantes bacterium]NIN47554.1 hypothetical protein [Candidatus Aminicenantes bacterium]NIN90474.1 hypothetical protein [Candidatus Aminicenantes bacterium]
MKVLRLFFICCFFIVGVLTYGQQPLSINSPKANANLCIGTTYPITWTTSGAADNFVELYLKTSDGRRNVEVIAEHTRNDGEFQWKVPDHIRPGSYTIGIKGVDTNISRVGARFKIIKCLTRVQTVKKPALTVKPVTPVRPARPIIKFSQLDHGDVELSPPGLKIIYGQSILQLNSGDNKTLNIPEDSPLVDSRGKVSVIIEFSLRNKTTKNFDFNVVVLYDNRTVFTERIKLFSKNTKTIRRSVKLSSTSGPKRLIVQGPVGISDDTHIVFFNARLWVRIYAL